MLQGLDGEEAIHAACLLETQRLVNEVYYFNSNFKRHSLPIVRSFFMSKDLFGILRGTTWGKRQSSVVETAIESVCSRKFPNSLDSVNIEHNYILCAAEQLFEFLVRYGKCHGPFTFDNIGVANGKYVFQGLRPENSRLRYFCKLENGVKSVDLIKQIDEEYPDGFIDWVNPPENPFDLLKNNILNYNEYPFIDGQYVALS